MRKHLRHHRGRRGHGGTILLAYNYASASSVPSVMESVS
jgi:hypothetical protein